MPMSQSSHEALSVLSSEFKQPHSALLFVWPNLTVVTGGEYHALLERTGWRRVEVNGVIQHTLDIRTEVRARLDAMRALHHSFPFTLPPKSD